MHMKSFRKSTYNKKRSKITLKTIKRIKVNIIFKIMYTRFEKN